MDMDDERVFGDGSLQNGSLQTTSDLAPTTTTTSTSRQNSRPASATVYASSSTTAAPLSPAPSHSTAASRPKHASHSVTMGPTTSSNASPSAGLAAYGDVYSHPAAVAYATAHPRRQIPKFGPYLLLQTLGEGEFGKVKLGLHCQYGEEVAVKLIRRGSVDNAVRFSKIEREIEVLRGIKHPNIVRLYDVIETDKYIGIILEYASGGELFDHILAHRYLRERDAAKLFAQLISGVSYIHAKKIVHRDLKLENLLLDRNRNVIITDFGFANKFEHKADDLMQTSCGSPCYAAPELVISEGLYVGSAVDIWSCGVILYAMLAGYLPFDDDPANPDGDNINLLYKYIINTPLTFPDYVSAEARDLLGMMLVPDPARRCTLDMIKQHSWLRPYASLFEKSVEELESQAMEIQNSRRLAYQRQMRQREREREQQQQAKMARTQSARLDNSSGMGGGHLLVPSPTSTRSGRHQQPPMPEFLYETGGANDLVPPTTGRRVVASAIIPTTRHSAMDDDPFAPSTQAQPQQSSPHQTKNHGEHSYDDGNRSRKNSTRSKKGSTKPSALATPPMPASPPGTAGGKKKGGYRHTIQLEYDEGDQSSAQPPLPIPQPPPLPQPESNGVALETPGSKMVTDDPFVVTSPATNLPPTSALHGDLAVAADAVVNGIGISDEMVDQSVEATTGHENADVEMPLAVTASPEPRAESPIVEKETNGIAVTDDTQATPKKASSSSQTNTNATPTQKKTPSILTSALESSPPGAQEANGVTTPKGSKSSPVTQASPTFKRAGTEPAIPTQITLREEEDLASIPAASNEAEPSHEDPTAVVTSQHQKVATEASQPSSLAPSTTSAVSIAKSASATSNKSSRHRKGLSMDKFNLGKFLGSDHSAEKLERAASMAASKQPPTAAVKKNSLPPSSYDNKKRSSTSVTLASGDKSEKPAKDDAASQKSKKSRRKTLSLMVTEPFGGGKSKDRSKNGKKTDSVTVTKEKEKDASPSTDVSQASPVEKAPSSIASETPVPVQEKPVVPETNHVILPATLAPQDVEMGPTGSTGKAKRVMDWFRKKSLAKSGDSVFAPVTAPADPHRPPVMTIFEKTTGTPAPFNGTTTEADPATPTVATYKNGVATSKDEVSSASSAISATPQVVVTAVGGQQPSNWEPTPRIASGASHGSTDTAASAQSTAPSKTSPTPQSTQPSSSTSHIAKRAAEALANVASKSPPAAAARVFNNAILRVHHGAVDHATITSGSPPEVFAHVTEVLLSMGIEIHKESEYKYRCIRQKRKKGANTGLGIKDGSTGVGLSAINMSGAAASNGVDRRGLPIPSSTTFGTGGMLRGLLLRRGSSHASAMQPISPLVDSEGEQSTASPAESGELTATPKIPPEIIYGDRSVDQQDEVRFSVELTRLDRLEDTYSLDIRRLKGNLRSYKFLYDTLRERATPAI
ncbi:hypothetical protein FRC03_009124 [Tulasnella sp. 419]|nr:hypothetical protein FRC03_009124 [Tulasnella sp. 419]